MANPQVDLVDKQLVRLDDQKVIIPAGEDRVVLKLGAAVPTGKKCVLRIEASGRIVDAADPD